ncbi:MAG: hypothetical protein ACLPSH_10345 [Vulcanimicrobiaceae bacterium]
MITLRQMGAFATSAFLSLGIFAAPALANNPRGPIPTPINFQGSITGTIKVPTSDLVHGFNANTCRGFVVDAQVPAKHQPKPSPGGNGIHLQPPEVMTTVAKSGKMTATLDGNSVACSYAINDLGAGTYTVAPGGAPKGFQAGLLEPYFNPQSAIVKLKKFGLYVNGKSDVGFSFGEYLYGK